MWHPGAAIYQQFSEISEAAPQTSIFNHAFGYGWNEHGHEVAGNLLTWNASGPFVFTRNCSWDNHGGDDLSDSNWKDFEHADAHLPNGYYAIGGRCAHD